MELKLEIEEGSKYNNLINEIEDEFKNTYKKANLCKICATQSFINIFGSHLNHIVTHR